MVVQTSGLAIAAGNSLPEIEKLCGERQREPGL